MSIQLPLFNPVARSLYGPVYGPPSSGGAPPLTETAVEDGTTIYTPVELSANWNLLSGSGSGIYHQNDDTYDFVSDLVESAVEIVGSDGAKMIRCTIIAHTGGSDGGFLGALRVTDENNFVGFRAYNGNIEVYQRVSGSFTLVGNAGAYSGPHTVELYIDDDDNVWVNDVNIGTTTLAYSASLGAGAISRSMNATVTTENYVWGI